MKLIPSLRKFDSSEVAQKRMAILKFYATFGEMATKEAFGVDRKVVSRWRQRLNQSGGKLVSLVPKSTRPHQVRQPATKTQLVEFIRDQRTKHYRIGKEKLKVFLDQYCQKERLPSISESTIGNVIKRNKFFFQKKGKTYHDPSSKWALSQVKKTKRTRVKHAPKPAEYGYVNSDAVERITDGIKEYFISAIDVKMKFALTLNYKHLTSENMLDFYHKFKKVYPSKILTWQSDNGSENLGLFDQQLKKDQIPHLFIYPRCPKIDTYIERYNRTLQEEFIDPNLDTIHDKGVFGKQLSDYVLYYNSLRPHHSLNNLSPLQYFVEKGGMSQKSLTYTYN
jgi:transposase InsO family protein